MTVPAIKIENAVEQLKLGSLQGILYVGLSVGILCYAGWFGFYPIILFFLLWLPFLAYRGSATRRITKEIFIPLLLGILYVASTLWSDATMVTAKSSLEAVSMILCSIIIARVVRLKDFLNGVCGGLTIVLIASLIDGTYAVDFFSGTNSLIGLFASKNQVGLCAEVGLFVTSLLLCSREALVKKLLAYSIPMVVCAMSLYLSHSATSVASLGLTYGLCLAFIILLKAPQSVRGPFLALFFATVVIGALGFFLVGGQDAGYALLGKDATLTGRTLLWSRGINFGLDNPLAGVGFGAFWIPGRPLAEELWNKFGVSARIGFHFHDTFVEAFVELGVIGVALFVALLAYTLLKSVRIFLARSAGLLSVYAFGISIMMIIRSTVEVDLLGTYSIGPMLFLVVPTYLSEKAVVDETLKAKEVKNLINSVE